MIFSNNKLGKFIRNGRQDLGLTQEQLAEKLNCNLSYLGNLERGQNIPSLKLFCRIILILCPEISDTLLINSTFIREGEGNLISIHSNISMI